MTTGTLSPGHAQHVADLFARGDIIWQHGWGDRDGHTCLHGALLRPCAEPGDEIMWSALLSYRGLTMAWNDSQQAAAPVIAALRGQSDPDEAEMVRVFGPNWQAARQVCRRDAASTKDERRDARAARAARDAWDAWDARDARDARAERAERDARDARAAWAAWDAWDARDAWDAWDAFLATIARPWIADGSAWDQATYDRLIAPWEAATS